MRWISKGTNDLIPEAAWMIRFAHGLKDPFHDRMLTQSAFISHVVEAGIKVVFFTIDFSAYIVKCLSPG